MKKILFIIIVGLISINASAGTYYVATTGNNGADGTISAPWATLAYAWTQSAAGDTVYLRGGTWNLTTSTQLYNKSGTANAPICIFNYPGETVVFDYGGSTYTTISCIQLYNADYIHIKGIRVTDVWTAGTPWTLSYGVLLSSDVNYCKFENIECDHIYGWGFQIAGTSHDDLFLNCDSHHCQDPYSPGNEYGGSDGFLLNSVSGGSPDNITFTGCRSWWNSDDGWDLRSYDGHATFNNCLSFWNGYIPGTFDAGGNGIGYKMAGNYTPIDQYEILRTFNNCVAFQNRDVGFDTQFDYASPADRLGIVLYNCTAYDNVVTGIRIQETIDNIVVRNCLSYENAYNYLYGTGVDHQYNSSDLVVTVTAADFASLDTTGVSGTRESNGSVPDIDFLRLVTGSDLIDVGIPVPGIVYYGSAPDLGAFETGGEPPYWAPKGIGWEPNYFKVNQRDTMNFTKPFKINGTTMTSTASELNTLDGIAVNTNDLNATAGATGNFQNQINAISSSDNFSVYDALNTGILAESFGISISEAGGYVTDIGDGTAYYQAVYIKENSTITGVKFWVSQTGAYNQDNFNGVALYSYSAGVITQVATSANDSTLWETTQGNAVVWPFTETYTAAPGLYYVGYLYNAKTATTTPRILCISSILAYNLFDAHVYQTSQTTLATSLTLSSATNLVNPRWFILY